MKQITAIIRPHRLDKVEAALHEQPHLLGFTILPSLGHPRGHGNDHSFAGDEWNPSSHQQITLLVFCAVDHADGIVNAIAKAAHTGLSGDGIIGVTELLDVVRIRTGERANAAL
jgi:nitrogen regulatory protein P-II 1